MQNGDVGRFPRATPQATRRNRLHEWLKTNRTHGVVMQGHGCVICGDSVDGPLVSLITTHGGRLIHRQLRCHLVTCIADLVGHAGSLNWTVVGPASGAEAPEQGGRRLAELATLNGLVVPKALCEAVYRFRQKNLGGAEEIVTKTTPMGSDGILVRIEIYPVPGARSFLAHRGVAERSLNPSVVSMSKQDIPVLVTILDEILAEAVQDAGGGISND